MCDIFVKSYEDSLLKGGTEAALFSMTVRMKPSIDSFASSVSRTLSALSTKQFYTDKSHVYSPSRAGKS